MRFTIATCLLGFLGWTAGNHFGIFDGPSRPIPVSKNIQPRPASENETLPVAIPNPQGMSIPSGFLFADDEFSNEIRQLELELSELENQIGMNLPARFLPSQPSIEAARTESLPIANPRPTQSEPTITIRNSNAGNKN